MDVGEAIRSQRAVRRFADRPVADDVLDEILDAARRAPSSMNCDHVIALGYPRTPSMRVGVREPHDRLVDRERWH